MATALVTPPTPAPAPAQAAPAITPTPYASASLYVGDLHSDVTETMLFEIFKAVGPIASIRVCRDAITRRSLGYAYVNFHNVLDAERALDTMNYTNIKGRCCRIMWSHRDPSLRKSGQGNVFIKNLDKAIDHKALYDTFSAFGNILSCKIVTDENGNSKGYGFVHYATQEEGDQAVQKVNGMLLNDKIVFVGHFIARKERKPGSEGEPKFTNVYVKNLDESVSDEQLRELFGKYGPISSCVIMRDSEKSKGFGFVNYLHPEDAKQGVDEMNGKDVNGKVIYAGRAQKKSEREFELRSKFEQLKMERMNKYQGVNLYIKNLDDSLDDDKLQQEFAQFGNITSCRIMRDDKNSNSKGFGFVCFSSPEEATKAVTEMNGKMLASKPIYVALAQRKDVRRAQLEAQHRQLASAGLARAAAAAIGGIGTGPQNMFAPGAPTVFYPHPIPGGHHRQQAGFISMYPPTPQHQQIIRPRWNASGPPPTGIPQGQARAPSYQPMPTNYVPGVPMATQMSGRGPSGQQPIAGGPVPNGNRNRGFKYTPNARNQGRDMGIQNNQQTVPAAIVPSVVPVVEVPTVEHTVGLSASVLAAASPEERKQMIGESLFPLIQSHEPEQAGKITGMLLESMEQGELIHLIESPDALNKKIHEAMEVLAHATDDHIVPA